MDYSKIKLVAFDLDGTLTQHKTPLSEENRAVLDQLSKRYKLIMVGAGMCQRIFEQMNHYPIDIIGNYGMQVAAYDRKEGSLSINENIQVPCDRASVEARVAEMREKYGYTNFAGDSVEYHSSGCITFPLLGTAAAIEDKLSFDPDRTKRRRIYEDVKHTFSEYNVVVGGSSSFDMSPVPYNKYYALDKYCREKGILHSEVAYVGDDYGMGGNDESVYLSDFPFITIDDYRTFPSVMECLLKNKEDDSI